MSLNEAMHGLTQAHEQMSVLIENLSRTLRESVAAESPAMTALVTLACETNFHTMRTANAIECIATTLDHLITGGNASRSALNIAVPGTVKTESGY